MIKPTVPPPPPPGIYLYGDTIITGAKIIILGAQIIIQGYM